MPWIEKRVKMLREEFIIQSLQADRNFSVLCEEYGISRKTGYKWLKRYRDEKSVDDHSRTPKNISNKTDEAIERLIIDVRKKHPGWGARKIQVHLRSVGHVMPCIRTVNNILGRNGLIAEEASLARRPFKRFERERNNELWQADFKGDILMVDGNRCYPLTILDDHSRYALLIEPKHDQRDVIKSFIDTFRIYGVPEAILTDNGANFAGFKNGYTQFERALLDQDILPIHGRAYHPQTQGKIERFHRSLDNEVLKFHRLVDFSDATRILLQWKVIYNCERPHQALGDRCPAQVYSPSLREYKEKVSPYDYNSQYRLYKINNWGFLRFADYQIYISETFRDTHVQLIPSEGDDAAFVCYRNYIIAKIDVTNGELHSRKAYRLRCLV
jgi:transposase InsO family protein